MKRLDDTACLIHISNSVMDSSELLPKILCTEASFSSLNQANDLIPHTCELLNPFGSKTGRGLYRKKAVMKALGLVVNLAVAAAVETAVR